MNPEDIQPVIIKAVGNRDPLGVAYVDDEADAEPWKDREPRSSKLTCPLPAAVNITLANMIYFEKSELPQPLANQLIRLAAFQNPEFYKAQAMRMSVWDKPRIIGAPGGRQEGRGLPGALPPGVSRHQNELPDTSAPGAGGSVEGAGASPAGAGTPSRSRLRRVISCSCCMSNSLR